MTLTREEIKEIATRTANEIIERRGDICKCIDWFLVATTAAEALEHNATVSDMAKDLHENLKEIIPEKQLEDLEFKHILLQGYITENIAEMTLSGSLGSIRDKCEVDISDVKELAAKGFEAIRMRNPTIAAESFTKVKVELLKLAGKICGKEEGVKPTGTCYEEAWRLLIKEGEGELIHGTVLSEGRRIGHAWVELPTGYIWEPQTKNYYTRGGFNIAASPVEEHRYSPEEAAIMVARVGKHGPWTEEERARWLKRKAE